MKRVSYFFGNILHLTRKFLRILTQISLPVSDDTGLGEGVPSRGVGRNFFRGGARLKNSSFFISMRAKIEEKFYVFGTEIFESVQILKITEMNLNLFYLRYRCKKIKNFAFFVIN